MDNAYKEIVRNHNLEGTSSVKYTKLRLQGVFI